MTWERAEQDFEKKREEDSEILGEVDVIKRTLEDSKNPGAKVTIRKNFRTDFPKEVGGEVPTTFFSKPCLSDRAIGIIPRIANFFEITQTLAITTVSRGFPKDKTIF